MVGLLPVALRDLEDFEFVLIADTLVVVEATLYAEEVVLTISGDELSVVLLMNPAVGSDGVAVGDDEEVVV